MHDSDSSSEESIQTDSLHPAHPRSQGSKGTQLLDNALLVWRLDCVWSETQPMEQSEEAPAAEDNSDGDQLAPLDYQQ